MKRIILFISAFFVGILANAQVSEEAYFSIKDDFIVWIKIYESKLDLEAMRKNPLLEFTSETEGIIKKSKPIPLTKRMLDEITGSFRIEEKEGRYKVEVLNIRGIPSLTYTIGGISSTLSDYPVEDLGLNKKLDFNDYFLNHLAKPYSNLFSKHFDPQTKDSNW